MESKHVDDVLRMIRRGRMLWKLYKYRKPILMLAGTGIGYLAACCFLRGQEARRSIERESAAGAAKSHYREIVPV